MDRIDDDVGRGSRAAREIRIFFALTFAISWGVGGLFLALHGVLEPVFGRFGPHNAFFYVAAYAPTLAALILSVAFEGTAGLAALFGRLVRPFHPVWIAVAALLFPALALALTALPLSGWPDSSGAILIAFRDAANPREHRAAG